jgi:starvation-inducible DNA-binding protein
MNTEQVQTRRHASTKSDHQRIRNDSLPSAESKAQDVSEAISRENQPHSAVVMQLQRQVANAYMLYTNYKHYHWNTYGPLFRDLHLLFDEFAEAVLKTSDGFAERIRMIGQDPLFRPIEVAETATVKSSDPGNFTMRDMIAEADRNLLTVIKEMRMGVHTANEQDDPGTADLFTQVVQIHEKHEWWLRVMLEKSDGLTKAGDQ